VDPQKNLGGGEDEWPRQVSAHVKNRKVLLVGFFFVVVLGKDSHLGAREQRDNNRWSKTSKTRGGGAAELENSLLGAVRTRAGRDECLQLSLVKLPSSPKSNILRAAANYKK